MDSIDVDLLGPQSRLNGALRNFAEDYALAVPGAPRAAKMPGDGFPFPVKVGGEIFSYRLSPQPCAVATTFFSGSTS